MTTNNLQMAFSPEEYLNEDHWKEEAVSVINDVKEHVKDIHVSKTLNSNNKFIYLNVSTQEGEDYCVELSGLGFRIVGNSLDDNSSPSEKIYETPYSLLGDISLRYRESFGESLVKKLEAIQDN